MRSESTPLTDTAVRALLQYLQHIEVLEAYYVDLHGGHLGPVAEQRAAS